MTRLSHVAKIASLAVGATLLLAGTGSAQIGNGAQTIEAFPSGQSSASAPVGPGLSRLPTTTPTVTPYASTGGTPPVGNAAGAIGESGVGSNAYGLNTSYKWPYTIARVAVTGAPYNTTNGAAVPVSSRPYRYAGKLWMRFGSSWYVCTASLVKKGVLITAAHCVHNYGQGQAGFADEVRWYPSNYAAAGGPFGFYTGQSWRVPTPYVNGTDTCQTGATGVVCNNDIATVRLAPRNGAYPGTTMGGWYAYGWNGYSFLATPIFGNATVAAITQIGYPVAIDNGYQMLRGDSFGKFIAMTGSNGKALRNTQLGSAMTGGSSGGPWLVNFGTAPVVTGSASLGKAGTVGRNIVVGVTSWGYTTVGINVQGASWFGQNAEFPLASYGAYGAGNIGKLMQDTCTANPGNC
ncbi:trypsin-like serine peptidase [Mesorhizobium australicum]|uniref:Trypsin n=1 Tax=Mesorhizobium australicum TaxID=536018 RepID=A0A1X7NNX1_9HYPH|nr:trypsin-like serine protease [Mesorhizobium australicum]SMH38798.1 Trypsin [Mesorhizobium australicum]